VEFATHDWNGVSLDDRDAWADVKTPGDGRTYSVGTTIALDPNAAGPTPFSGEAGPQNDALRIQVDMRPFGVSLVDSTVVVGSIGGTTPACALSSFGNIPAPAVLERIYLDIDGTPGPGADISVLVDRPAGGLSISAIWIGFPVLTPSPFPGIEVFGSISTAVFSFAAVTDESWRFQMPTLPNAQLGTAAFTIQFVSILLPQDYCLTASGCASLCTPGIAFDSVASPALLISY
jgi:hypothetical protein